MDTKQKLDTLRDTLLRELISIQEGINKNLKSIHDEPIKDILLKIIDRQDKLFEYYVSSREEIVSYNLKKQKEIENKQNPVKKCDNKPQNSFVECMDLLLKYF